MSGDFVECAIALPAPPVDLTQLAIATCGDSLTAGGSGIDDLATGYRTAFWQRLRTSRAGLTFRGTNAVGVQVMISLPTVDPILADWRTASQGGYTLAQIDGLAAAAEALQGPADVYVLLGGENDIAAASPPTVTVADLQALVATFIGHRLAANPAAFVVVSMMTRHKAPCLDFAARNAIVGAFNAALPGFLASYSNPRILASSAGAGITDPLIGADGVHLTGAGDVVLGNALAASVLAATSGPGPFFPRSITPRAPVPRLGTPLHTAGVIGAQDTGAAILGPSGNETFSAGLLYRPSDVVAPGYQTILLQVGAAAIGVGSLYLLQSIPLAGGDFVALELYLNGVAHFVGNVSLKADRWHLIAVVCDADEHSATVYCLREGTDGKPETICVSRKMGLPAWNMTSAAGYLWSGCLGGLFGSTGLRGDLWIARGKAISSDDLEAWYLDGTRPNGITALYPLTEGVGGTLHPDPSTPAMPNGVTNGTWSPAGAVPEPWDP